MASLRGGSMDGISGYIITATYRGVVLTLMHPLTNFPIAVISS